MSSQVTAHDIAVRLANFPHDRYLYVGGVMRSVAWAAGTLVLLQILRRREWPRLAPWIVALLSTMITLMTWGRGVLFTNSRANEWDSVLTTLMGIVEFCLFALLMSDYAPDPMRKGKSGVISEPKVSRNKIINDLRTIWRRRSENWVSWHAWFLVLWIHPFLAIWLVWNRMSLTQLAYDYEPCLYKVITPSGTMDSLPGQYMRWMADDRFGATVASAAFLVSGLLALAAVHGYKSRANLSSRWLKRTTVWVLLYLLAFAIPIGLPCYVVRKADKERREAEDEIFRLVYSNKPSIPCEDAVPIRPAATPMPSPSP